MGESSQSHHCVVTTEDYVVQMLVSFIYGANWGIVWQSGYVLRPEPQLKTFWNPYLLEVEVLGEFCQSFHCVVTIKDYMARMLVSFIYGANWGIVR